MQRLKAVIANSERGASAVLVGILLISLMGFGALAVDVGALWSDRKQVQNGADAGALAVAQSCAKNPASAECKLGEVSTSSQFARDNKLDGNASGKVVDLTASSVTVETTSTRELWLARILGFDSTPVTTRATASWGAIGGANTIPVTIAECAFAPEKLGDPVSGWVHLVTKDPGGVGKGEDPCSPDSKTPHVIPGGFHWLKADSGCSVRTDANSNANSDPGNDAACDETKLNQILQSGSILIPLFDTATGTGAGAKYHLVGYASFIPTAYCLTNKVNWNTDKAKVDPGKCTGSERWIEGHFVKFVSLEDAVTSPTAPDFGTKTVSLTG